MPVPLPPASVGLVFFPHPSHVHQSVHSTCLAHSGLAHGPGLGLSCPTYDQPVKSGYAVGKVLLLLTNVDYPAPKATGSPDSSQRGRTWANVMNHLQANQLSRSSSKPTLPWSPRR